MSHEPTHMNAEPCWHVSRRIAVRPDEAPRALGEVLRSGALAPGLDGDLAVDRVRHARPGEASGFTGRLRLGKGLGTVRVEVELEPWSRSESALGLRPVRRPPRYRGERYFQRAVALLDGLEIAVLERVATPQEHAPMRRAS